jgi:replication-associated recombination protein RarA
VRQTHLPESLRELRFYEPAEHGDEKVIRERLAWWARKLDEREP